MIGLYNNAFIDEKKGDISILNRAFKYGDGLFETVAVIRGQPRFLRSHIDRLRDGAQILKMSIHDGIEEGALMEKFYRLMASAGNPPYAVFRIYLFREDGGLYCPSSDKANVLLTLEESPCRPIMVANCAAFSERVVNFPSTTSRLKTMSALQYIIAGLEKKEKSLDEIVIKDYQGHISEALSSNIFWKQGKSYYTPSLETGCINGIMRHWLMAQLEHEGHTTLEVLALEDELLAADSVFTVNAMGLQHILSIKNRKFSKDKSAEYFVLKLS